jgi:hypothetical protein
LGEEREKGGLLVAWSRGLGMGQRGASRGSDRCGGESWQGARVALSAGRGMTAARAAGAEQGRGGRLTGGPPL